MSGDEEMWQFGQFYLSYNLTIIQIPTQQRIKIKAFPLMGKF